MPHASIFQWIWRFRACGCTLRALRDFPPEAQASGRAAGEAQRLPKGAGRGRTAGPVCISWQFMHAVSHSTADLCCCQQTRSDCFSPGYCGLESIRTGVVIIEIRLVTLLASSEAVCMWSKWHALLDSYGVVCRSLCPSFMRQDGTGVPEEEPRVRKPLGTQIRSASAIHQTPITFQSGFF